MNLEKPIVFVSYSNTDVNIISPVLNGLQEKLNGLYDFKYWAKDKSPGEEDWDSIFKWIKESSVVLVFILLNRDSNLEDPKIGAIENSLSVGIESGYALSQKKKIIPVLDTVTKDATDRLGPLKFKTWILFDHAHPDHSLDQLAEHLSKLESRIRLDEQPAFKALNELRTITLVFAESYYQQLEPPKCMYSEPFPSSIDAIQRRLQSLKTNLEEVTSPLDSWDEFCNFKVHLYRMILSLTHQFRPEFEDFVCRFDDLGVLSRPARHLLKDSLSHMEKITVPLLNYEIPCSDGGVIRNQFYPTESAYRAAKLLRIAYLDEKELISGLYEEYKNSNMQGWISIKALKDNLCELIELILSGTAIQRF